MSNYKAVEVIGVRVEMPSNQPIVLLKEIDGVRYLPIWVGSVEASAIAFAQQGLVPPRPMTHDLLAQTISLLGADLLTVLLTELRDGVFYAELKFKGATGESTLSARPSDAVALALRTGTPILATEELFNQAGIEIPSAEEDEVEKFREFLDEINPEDFLA
jgi:bifunctional DNase/RNase